jgi:ribosomal protein L40E
MPSLKRETKHSTCIKCGKDKLVPEAYFCGRCGTKLLVN